MNIGGNIKRIRESKGISAVFVSNELGVDPSTVSKWESDQRQVKADILPKLAKALGCTEQDFFDQKVDDSSIMVEVIA